MGAKSATSLPHALPKDGVTIPRGRTDEQAEADDEHTERRPGNHHKAEHQAGRAGADTGDSTGALSRLSGTPPFPILRTATCHRARRDFRPGMMACPGVAFAIAS